MSKRIKKVALEKKTINDKLSDMSNDEKVQFYENYYITHSKTFTATDFFKKRILFIFVSLVSFLIPIYVNPNRQTNNELDILQTLAIIPFLLFIAFIDQIIIVRYFWNKYDYFRKEILD